MPRLFDLTFRLDSPYVVIVRTAGMETLPDSPSTPAGRTHSILDSILALPAYALPVSALAARTRIAVGHSCYFRTDSQTTSSSCKDGGADDVHRLCCCVSPAATAAQTATACPLGPSDCQLPHKYDTARGLCALPDPINRSNVQWSHGACGAQETGKCEAYRPNQHSLRTGAMVCRGRFLLEVPKQNMALHAISLYAMPASAGGRRGPVQSSAPPPTRFICGSFAYNMSSKMRRCNARTPTEARARARARARSRAPHVHRMCTRTRTRTRGESRGAYAPCCLRHKGHERDCPAWAAGELRKYVLAQDSRPRPEHALLVRLQAHRDTQQAWLVPRVRLRRGQATEPSDEAHHGAVPTVRN